MSQSLHRLQQSGFKLLGHWMHGISSRSHRRLGQLPLNVRPKPTQVGLSGPQTHASVCHPSLKFWWAELFDWPSPWSRSPSNEFRWITINADYLNYPTRLEPHSLSRTQLAKFHRISELNGRYLCKTVADRMSRFCDPSLGISIFLAMVVLLTKKTQIKNHSLGMWYNPDIQQHVVIIQSPMTFPIIELVDKLDPFQFSNKKISVRDILFQDRSVAAYIALANMSLDKEELGWPSRPKFHVPGHVILSPGWVMIVTLHVDSGIRIDLRLGKRFAKCSLMIAPCLALLYWSNICRLLSKWLGIIYIYFFLWKSWRLAQDWTTGSPLDGIQRTLWEDWWMRFANLKPEA